MRIDLPKHHLRQNRAVHSALQNVADIGHALEVRILRPKRCLPVTRTGQNDAVRHGQPGVGGQPCRAQSQVRVQIDQLPLAHDADSPQRIALVALLQDGSMPFRVETDERRVV
jgi:uncharacterized membrane protein